MPSLKISSGSDAFDSFLEGGYEKDIVTTLYGPPGSGKTTLCMLASISQARDRKKVIYIDTEGGFSLERMQQLAGSEFDSLFSYIVLLKPTTFEEQDKGLKKLKDMVSPKIGLIVVDTMTIFYRLELALDKGIRKANNKLIWQVSYLNEIARKNGIPVIATNQVYSDFKNRDEVKMVGGDILKYSSKCLISLKSLARNKRKAVIISHRSIPEGKEEDFAIINEGIIEA
ncbi:DNA repair and recombination protein RadB [Candidatus Woesearchaeota archaeon]|nr:DNA repair and recombination protein RadB [Candidatus Woesearchaeota archaeon]